MSVDYLICDNCGECFCDCGPYKMCDCGLQFCKDCMDTVTGVEPGVNSDFKQCKYCSTINRFIEDMKNECQVTIENEVVKVTYILLDYVKFKLNDLVDYSVRDNCILIELSNNIQIFIRKKLKRKD